MVIFNAQAEKVKPTDELKQSPDRYFAQTRSSMGLNVVHRVQDGKAESTFGEFGFHSDVLNAYGSERLGEHHRDLCIAIKELGVQMPKTYDLQKLILNPGLFPQKPIILKNVNANGGYGKVVVKSYEEMMRYLIWDSLGQTLTSYTDPRHPELLELVAKKRESIISAMSKWDGVTMGDHMWLNQKTMKIYRDEVERGGLKPKEALDSTTIREVTRVEEYIEGPADRFNTTLRVVVDVLGDVHYGQIHATKYQEFEDTETEWKTVSWGSDNSAEMSKRLHDPRSPLYIPRRKFLSNRIQGGEVTIIESMYINPEETDNFQNLNYQSVLTAHGIDLKEPRVPELVREVVKKVAHRLRYMYPILGIDFMQHVDGTWYFLEANSGPSLNPKAMGVADDYDIDQLTTETVIRLVNKINATAEI